MDTAQQQSVTTQELELIGARLEACRKRQKRWLDAYASEVIDLEEFKRLKAEIDHEINALERVMADLQGRLGRAGQRQAEVDAAVAFIKRVQVELPMYSIAEKRRVFELLDVRCVHTDLKSRNTRLYFLIPAEQGIDPAEIFDPGDTFAAEWGYLSARDTISPFKPGRG